MFSIYTRLPIVFDQIWPNIIELKNTKFSKASTKNKIIDSYVQQCAAPQIRTSTKHIHAHFCDTVSIQPSKFQIPTPLTYVLTVTQWLPSSPPSSTAWGPGSGAGSTSRGSRASSIPRDPESPGAQKSKNIISAFYVRLVLALPGVKRIAILYVCVYADLAHVWCILEQSRPR